MLEIVRDISMSWWNLPILWPRIYLQLSLGCVLLTTTSPGTNLTHCNGSFYCKDLPVIAFRSVEALCTLYFSTVHSSPNTSESYTKWWPHSGKGTAV